MTNWIHFLKWIAVCSKFFLYFTRYYNITNIFVTPMIQLHSWHNQNNLCTTAGVCIYVHYIYIYICICILCIYNKIYTKIKPNRYWKCFGYCLYQLIIKKSFFSYDIFYNELTSHNLHNLHQWTTKFLKRRYFINYLMEYLIHI